MITIKHSVTAGWPCSLHSFNRQTWLLVRDQDWRLYFWIHCGKFPAAVVSRGRFPPPFWWDRACIGQTVVKSRSGINKKKQKKTFLEAIASNCVGRYGERRQSIVWSFLYSTEYSLRVIDLHWVPSWASLIITSTGLIQVMIRSFQDFSLFISEEICTYIIRFSWVDLIPHYPRTDPLWTKSCLSLNRFLYVVQVSQSSKKKWRRWRGSLIGRGRFRGNYYVHVRVSLQDGQRPVGQREKRTKIVSQGNKSDPFLLCVGKNWPPDGKSETRILYMIYSNRTSSSPSSSNDAPSVFPPPRSFDITSRPFSYVAERRPHVPRWSTTASSRVKPQRRLYCFLFQKSCKSSAWALFVAVDSSWETKRS